MISKHLAAGTLLKLHVSPIRPVYLHGGEREAPKEAPKEAEAELRSMLPTWKDNTPPCTILYCAVLCCIILYCAVLYCTTLIDVTPIASCRAEVPWNPSLHHFHAALSIERRIGLLLLLLTHCFVAALRAAAK